MRLVDRARGWGLNKLSGGDFERQMNGLREAEDFFLERAMEDAKWRKLGTDQDLSVADRDKVRQWARWAFNGGDPFIKRGVQCITEFCFGNGIDGPRTLKEDVGAEVLDEFWDDRANQSAMFSTAKQYEMSNNLLVDGDLFILVYDKDPVQVRRLGPGLVRNIITDPEDVSRPLYYVTAYVEQELDAETGTLRPVAGEKLRYYKALLNDDPVTDPFAEDVEAMPGVSILHMPLDRIGDNKFGTSAVAGSLRWFLAAKRIAEDQATSSRATAALMIRLSVSGNEADILRLASQFRPDSTETGDEARHHAPPMQGSANIMNESVNLDVNRANTQGNDAFTNSRLMRMPGAAGMGLNLHYLADPENANLATSTSMELPVLKHFVAHQSLWVDTYRQLCGYALTARGIDPSDSEYDIPVPQMIEPDIPGTANAIIDGYEAALATQEQASTRLLTLLGFDDLEEEVAKVLEDAAEHEDNGSGDLGGIITALATTDEEDEE